MTDESQKQLDRSNRAATMHNMEAKHFGQCLWQSWHSSRRVLIECMEFPRARTTAIVVKTFERRVARGAPWPDLAACEVYVPINAGNTWEALDAALAAVAPRE